jgi:DNA repair exonuclease SbcCD ATPase subunit
MPELESKFRLPRLSKVKLQNFSLYAANPNAEFTCGEGVLCLIGANGIGKSTLLSAINYGLTGIIADPRREFKSFPEYYRDSKGYSQNYFQGRITESDREAAAIYLEFTVGDFRYDICRGIFEPEELRSLTITKRNTSEIIETDQDTNSERHSKYEEYLLQHLGMYEFGEFVFLQHFVLSFDERRITLFWNERVLERALYLVFGLDQSMANKADDLKREIERTDSRVRNLQWDATKTTRRINELRSKHKSLNSTQDAYDQLVKKHESLSARLNRGVQETEAIEKQLRDANLRLATLSAKESALREEYGAFFEKGFERRPPISQHPLLSKALSEQTCALCGEHGSEVERTIRAKVKAPNCPLCDSVLPLGPAPKADIDRLRKLDHEIAKAKKELTDVRKEIVRVMHEESKARKELEDSKEQLLTFDRENEQAMELLLSTLKQAGGAEGLLASYNAELTRILKDKKDAESARAKARDDLLKIQRKLQNQYLTLESKFVPAFTELAHLFLGMDLHIRLDSSDSTGLKLVVEVRGTARRHSDHLSESQRFFLDIALRMALIRFVSHADSKGSLFCDTPEGSLDIAYEKRAGEMLAKFVEGGHRILMTANLNSSKLLKALAKNCGTERMVLCRMTDWAELSDVQREEEGVFNDAYAEIEKELIGNVVQPSSHI